MTPTELVALRRAMRLTQEQLAETLDFARETVSRMETGTRVITRRTELAVRALALAARIAA